MIAMSRKERRISLDISGKKEEYSSHESVSSSSDATSSTSSSIIRKAGVSDDAKPVDSKRKRKSRWSSDTEKLPVPPPAVTPNLPSSGPGLAVISSLGSSTKVTSVPVIQPTSTSTDYTQQDLELEIKKKRLEILNKVIDESDKEFKYLPCGTEEHQQRLREMRKTEGDAIHLTATGEGKHHLADFLPPEEHAKFLALLKASKEKGGPDACIVEKAKPQSDYLQNKLTEANKGFLMLQKLGWKEGSGLGQLGLGITEPINQGRQSSDNRGLGADSQNEGSNDLYSAYRQRMMTAYKFRPNPMNNPRRPYY